MLTAQPSESSTLSPAELDILRYFRVYQMGASQMLCFVGGLAKLHPSRFNVAIATLIRRDYVVKERHPQGYSLTSRGYQVSLSISQ